MPYLANDLCGAHDVVDDGMRREEEKVKVGRRWFC